MTAIRILAIALLCGVGALFAAERADAAARPVGPSPGLTEDVPGAPIAFMAQEGETDIARYYGRMHAVARGWSRRSCARPTSRRRRPHARRTGRRSCMRC